MLSTVFPWGFRLFFYDVLSEWWRPIQQEPKRDNIALPFKMAPLRLEHEASTTRPKVSVIRRLLYFVCNSVISNFSSGEGHVEPTKSPFINQKQIAYIGFRWSTLTAWLVCWLIRSLGALWLSLAAFFLLLLIGISARSRLRCVDLWSG